MVHDLIHLRHQRVISPSFAMYLLHNQVNVLIVIRHVSRDFYSRYDDPNHDLDGVKLLSEWVIHINHPCHGFRGDYADNCVFIVGLSYGKQDSCGLMDFCNWMLGKA